MDRVNRILRSTGVMVFTSLVISCGSGTEEKKEDTIKTIGEIVDSINNAESKKRIVCEDSFYITPGFERASDCGGLIVKPGEFVFHNGDWQIQIRDRFGNFDIYAEGDSLLLPNDKCDYRIVHILKIQRDSNKVKVRVRSKCEQ